MTLPVGRTIVLATLLLCLPVAAMGGVVAAPEAGPGEGAATVGAFALQDDEDDEEPVRHRNPDEYDGDGDGETVERWLADRLEDSASDLGDGETALSGYVDAEYRERLTQYLEVAVGDESDSSASTDAQREHDELLATVAEYNETKAEYDAAREAGDDERAYDRARDLEALAIEIATASDQLLEAYDAISAGSDADLSAAAASVEAMNESVQTTQHDIREREFAATELTVDASQSSISYTDPLVGTGEVQTAAGEPIANEDIRLAVGNQEIQTETDETGAFEFEYRPISVPADTDTLTVAYLPDPKAGQLGAETTVPTEIEPVEPALSMSSVEPDPLAYGDELSLETTLSVDGEPVDAAVPMAVTIDGTDVGTLPSDPDAEYDSLIGTANTSSAANVTVPATVPAGEQALTVEPAVTDRALTPTSATTTVTITETEPELAFEAARVDDETVALEGTVMVDDDGVADVAVGIEADGTHLETLSTDETGTFEGTISLPADAADEDVELIAVHDDVETNLAETAIAATVAPPGGAGGLPTWAWAVVAVVVLAGSGAAGYWWRVRGPSTTDAPSVAGDRRGPDEAAVETAAQTPRSPAAPEPDPAVAQPLLAHAADRLAAGDPDTAVQTSYHAVRASLAVHLEATGTLTHWEFYRAYCDTAADRTESLQAVTEGYERAAFGRDGVADETAEPILERARELCGPADSSTDTDQFTAADD
ncbi:hypothetical protein [Natronorubrum tibetense]|uniref:hypothetical protein n=1 Tax=Natronorubrum tibetense TaxID=63128 RepID=UPI0012682C5A|nr:hypothetical protein [Natronorubrum tibetense]